MLRWRAPGYTRTKVGLLTSPMTSRDTRARIASTSASTARQATRHLQPEAWLRLVTPVGRRHVEDGISLRLKGSPDAGAQARQALGKLRGDLDPPLMETMRLLVTELVTNSVKHARADNVVLKVLVGHSSVWTEVTDEGPGFDLATTGIPKRQDRLGPVSWSSVWHTAGAWPEGHNTKVWFELRRG